MNLYLLTPKDEWHMKGYYDTVIQVAVIAKDKRQAKRIHPGYDFEKDKTFIAAWKKAKGDIWPTTMDFVDAELVCFVDPEMKPQVVLVDFYNA